MHDSGRPWIATDKNYCNCITKEVKVHSIVWHLKERLRRLMKNHTDEMTKNRSEHFTILVSPTHRTDLAPCYFHLFLQLKKTSDRTLHLIRCWGRNNSEDALLPNKKCSPVVVELQNHPNIEGAVCSTEKLFLFKWSIYPQYGKETKRHNFPAHLHTSKILIRWAYRITSEGQKQAHG